MLELHVPKIIAYLIERVVLLLYPSSFPIHSFQETSILEGAFREIFCCLIRFLCLESFYVNLNVFAIYTKDS